MPRFCSQLSSAHSKASYWISGRDLNKTGSLSLSISSSLQLTCLDRKIQEIEGLWMSTHIYSLRGHLFCNCVSAEIAALYVGWTEFNLEACFMREKVLIGWSYLVHQHRFAHSLFPVSHRRFLVKLITDIKTPTKCITLWCNPVFSLINKRSKNSISQIYCLCWWGLLFSQVKGLFYPQDKCVSAELI